MASVSGSSGGHLHVDPAELQIHGDQLHTHASDLKDAHDAAHRALTDAQAGFGSGRAANALGNRISEWEKETADHHAELTSHGENHKASAVKFVNRDALNRAGIEQAGPGSAV
ncbi:MULTISPECIES: WXG100 family type VII secretion target [unclassified Mycobacterium]|uniref:WXG100 family type VII secretion target n=1 Tax=unclassified Mycobacterium TaxID=2642494 RepID=UPI0009932E39|nr:MULTISPECIES: WXG100 family type VII secretion target [unclassified Mycobacterium]